MRTHTRPYATNQNRRQCDRGLRAAQILARQPRRGGHRHSGTDSADLGCHGDRQEFYEWNRRAFDLDRRFAAHTVAAGIRSCRGIFTSTLRSSLKGAGRPTNQTGVALLPSASIAFLALPPHRLSEQRLHCQFDVLRDRWQNTALVPRDGISRHAESRCQFLLREAEEEALTTQLPTGQADGRLLNEHSGSTDGRDFGSSSGW